MLAIHNTAPFKLVRAAAKYFRVKDGEPRSIINISSTSGLHGNAYVFLSLIIFHFMFCSIHYCISTLIGDVLY